MSIVVAPPSVVRVGELFLVTAFVGLSANAPLANFAVSMTITPAAYGVLVEDVDTFVRRFSGQNIPDVDKWTMPVLQPGSNAAVSDPNGLANFRVRISGAVTGMYTLAFTVENVGIVKVCVCGQFPRVIG